MRSAGQPWGRTPVLVIGAGPVGLVAAIRLREQGVDVRIVDEQTETSKRTYPVVIHPRTLRLLSSLGMTAPLEWRGRAIRHLAIYADEMRRAVLSLPSAEPIAPGVLTLPQDVLRQALVHRLSTLGVEVEWKTRLVAIDQDPARVRVELVRRETVEGPELKTEWLDVASQTLEVELVVAADGIRSTVRRALGIEMVQHGAREIYAFFDAADQRAGDEAHLVFSRDYGSSIYPLQGSVSRFSFQVGAGALQPPAATHLRQLLSDRMPWYAGGVDDFEWSGSAEFHPALAARFGEGRVWLAGDAAHATGPLGGQSVNVGMHEADDLALRMAEAFRDWSFDRLGPRYCEQRRIEWGRFFGLGPSKPDTSRAPEWVRRHVGALLPSLPAAGDDLDDLLEQLGVRTA
jgi:2-polyprenyl-6-methoxyphenol hydroxylase-like FAD-dependent oxidoreductase